MCILCGSGYKSSIFVLKNTYKPKRTWPFFYFLFFTKALPRAHALRYKPNILTGLRGLVFPRALKWKTLAFLYRPESKYKKRLHKHTPSHGGNPGGECVKCSTLLNHFPPSRLGEKQMGVRLKQIEGLGGGRSRNWRRKRCKTQIECANMSTQFAEHLSSECLKFPL